jgi:hypothetical protein
MTLGRAGIKGGRWFGADKLYALARKRIGLSSVVTDEIEKHGQVHVDLGSEQVG